MKAHSNSTFLEGMIRLLVEEYGESEVSAALAGVRRDATELPEEKPLSASSNGRKRSHPSLANEIESIRENDPKKYNLLVQFLSDLATRNTLPEAQDIRLFAQEIGLKAIEGKSRKDLIPKLIRHLLTLPLDRITLELKKTPKISEEYRRQGFSVLADALLRNQTEARK